MTGLKSKRRGKEGEVKGEKKGDACLFFSRFDIDRLIHVHA